MKKKSKLWEIEIFLTKKIIYKLYFFHYMFSCFRCLLRNILCMWSPILDSRGQSVFPKHHGWRRYCLFISCCFWAAGVFTCDRQELDMKGTANFEYDLINYICQWFPADLSPALHMLPLSQPTSQPVSQEIFCSGLDSLPGSCSQHWQVGLGRGRKRRKR